MADPAVPSSPRARGASSAQRRARAASADDARRPARVTVEPDTPAARESDDVAPIPAFDPRQGTLLGFERPADALLTLTDEQPAVAVEPAAPVRVVRAARGKPAAAEKPDAGLGIDPSEKAVVVQAEKTEGLGLETPVAAVQAAAVELPAAPASERMLADERAAAKRAAVEKPAAEKATAGKAAAEKAAVEKAAAPENAMAADQPVPLPAPAARRIGDAPRSFEGVLPPDLAQTVASLQEALAQERSAAHERWRRARHWLALASAALALLFVLCVGQTVALFGFAHRAQAAQEQTQSALAEQQAALAGLASSTSALAARIEAGASSGSALDVSAAANAANGTNGTQRPAKHAKPARARHPAAKDKPKLAAR